MQVYEVATFIQCLTLKPIGKYHIELCKTSILYVNGCKELKKLL